MGRMRRGLLCYQQMMMLPAASQSVDSAPPESCAPRKGQPLSPTEVAHHHMLPALVYNTRVVRQRIQAYAVHEEQQHQVGT